MRNYFPNSGAEDTTLTMWNGNSLFGTTVKADSEYSKEVVHSGNHSVKVSWPAPDGSGLPAAVANWFPTEGISGSWRVGAWVYVPSGSPDIVFGSAFGATTPMTVKDAWVNVELVTTVNSIAVDHGLTLQTDGETFAGIVYMDDIYAYPGATGEDSSEPEVKVEISWTGKPFDEDPVWDDITEYVQGFNPSYGRSSEIGSVEAGTCSLFLDNPDGIFTPKRQASPYYPNVKPRRPVRISADWDGALWPVFRGHVDRWPAETAAGTTVTEVALVDAFGVFTKKTLEIPYIYGLRDLAVREIYPLNDGPNEFAAYFDPNKRAYIRHAGGSGVTENNVGERPTVEAGSSDLLPNETGPGSVAVSGCAWYGTGNAATELSGRLIEFPYEEFDCRPSSTGWAISFWHQFDGSPAQGDTVLEDRADAMVLRLEDSLGRPFMTIIYNGNPFNPTGYRLFWEDPVYAPAGGWVAHEDFNANTFAKYKAPNHVVLSFSNDCRNDGSNIPGLGLFVNGWGSYYEIPGSPVTTLKREVRAFVGAHLAARPSEPIGPDNVMAHNFHASMFSIHDEPINGDFWDLGIMGYRAAGNPNERVRSRINYLLGQAKFPSSMRQLDNLSDDSYMRFIKWESEPNALDELRSPALDTNGLLFINPAGQATYHSRRRRLNPAPHFIFDHDAGTGIESPLSFDMSEEDIINVVNVNNAYGIKAQVRNESSVEQYDEFVKNADLRLENDSEAMQFGYWHINRFSEAQLRIDGVRVNPSAHATGGLWGHVLGMAPSVVIGLRNLPESAPDADRDYFVEAVAHEVQRDGDRLRWLTTLQVSPAEGHEAWLLGDSTYGVLGESTRLHY